MAEDLLGGIVGGDGENTEDASSITLQPRSLTGIGKIDSRFQSYNVEMAEVIGARFWAPYNADGTTPADKYREREPLDLRTDARLRNLARALGPAYMRVSGTWANSTYFQDDDQPAMKEPPFGYVGVLTRTQWEGVIDFAKSVDARIVTSFAVGAGARNPDGSWNPDGARRLLRYTRKIGGSLAGVQPINEPNLGERSYLPRNYDAAAFARDNVAFRALLDIEAPDVNFIGPTGAGDVGNFLSNTRRGIVGNFLFNARRSIVGSFLFNTPRGIVGNFLFNLRRGIPFTSEQLLSSEPQPKFDIFAYHFYTSLSQRCIPPQRAAKPEDALTEKWLDEADRNQNCYRALRDRFAPGAPIWVTEIGQAACGGDPWAKTFIDTFRYVDNMGRLARSGVAAIFHNTLAASDYALIDDRTGEPRPSYWAAVLWRRLLGEAVLDAGPLKPGFHIYAHSLRGRPGGVSLVALNLDRTKGATLKLPFEAERYVLSADDLLGTTAKLNGRPLALVGDALPAMNPEKIGSGAMNLPPASITFLALPSAANPACR
jgi:hypothetical protein